MNEPKPFASLSSGLLARKGMAKPAMRPQSFGAMGAGLEDLGWNDMGQAGQFGFAGFDDEPREHVPSSIAALTPAPKAHEAGSEHVQVGESPVIEQQRSIAASFESEEPEPEEIEEPQPVVPIRVPIALPAAVVQLPTRSRAAPGTKAKAAFTLRLDPERHLKLRLACAVRHRSAQQVVSEALDAFLKTLPELDSLAQQVPAKAGKRN